MKRYQWILFDADETLFHFDAFRGLQLMLSRFGVFFTRQDYEDYQTINRPLWVAYQNGSITVQELQKKRFNGLSSQVNKTPEELNTAFMAAMAEICSPLDGAISLIHALHGKANLGIITNGFADLQRIRLERMGLTDHFSFVVISEHVGFAKPHPGIFEHAFSMMDHPAREHILMVGDTPEADIQGGINAGIDTCWLNVDKRTAPHGMKPHYEVNSLKQLEDLLLSSHADN